MLPLLGFLYAVALIDRGNMGIARTAGMAADLVRIFTSHKFASSHSINVYS